MGVGSIITGLTTNMPFICSPSAATAFAFGMHLSSKLKDLWLCIGLSSSSCPEHFDDGFILETSRKDGYRECSCVHPSRNFSRYRKFHSSTYDDAKHLLWVRMTMICIYRPIWNIHHRNALALSLQASICCCAHLQLHCHVVVP